MNKEQALNDPREEEILATSQLEYNDRTRNAQNLIERNI